LSVGLLGNTYGKDFADVVDAGGGALKKATFDRMVAGIGDRLLAEHLKTDVEAGTELSAQALRGLSVLVGDPGVAREIAAALSS
jgi:hypothetical protein